MTCGKHYYEKPIRLRSRAKQRMGWFYAGRSYKTAGQGGEEPDFEGGGGKKTREEETSNNGDGLVLVYSSQRGLLKGKGGKGIKRAGKGERRRRRAERMRANGGFNVGLKHICSQTSRASARGKSGQKEIKAAGVQEGGGVLLI